MGLKLSDGPKIIPIIRFRNLESGDIFCCDKTQHLLMKCELSDESTDYVSAIDLFTGNQVDMDEDEVITRLFEKGIQLTIS